MPRRTHASNNKGPRDMFSWFARWTERQAGRAHTFGIAVALVVVWGVTGPLFDFSESWQLIINTGTTIITFLMVFVIQHAQNRDTQAIQLKLDELLRSNQNARNSLMTLEGMSEQELEAMKQAFIKLAQRQDAGQHESAKRE